MANVASMTTRPAKHSLTLHGHRTSVSLEPEFWDAFRAIAAERAIPLNALAAVSDIQSVAAFVNQQIAGGAPIAPETFYSKQLLDTIRIDADQFVYFRYADSMPIQEKADKLQLRP